MSLTSIISVAINLSQSCRTIVVYSDLRLNSETNNKRLTKVHICSKELSLVHEITICKVLYHDIVHCIALGLYTMFYLDLTCPLRLPAPL